MTARAEPMSPPHDAVSPWAPVTWTALSLILFVAASMAIFAVNTVLGIAELPHLVVMAEWSVVWGAFPSPASSSPAAWPLAAGRA